MVAQRKLLLAFLLAMMPGVTPRLAADDVTRLDAAALRKGFVPAAAQWRFNADESLEGGRPDLEDATWTLTDSALSRGQVPRDWDGEGWFRARVVVPEDGIYVLRSQQRGVSEIWIDGTRAALIGSAGTGGYAPLATGRTVVFLSAGAPHVLAVRYLNRDVGAYHRAASFGGFRITLALADAGLLWEIDAARANAGYLWFFTGIFGAFAAIHLLLWVYAREIRENLYFALLCLALANIAFFIFYRQQMGDPALLFVAERAMNFGGLAMGYFLLRYLYKIFVAAAPRFFRVFALACIGLAIWSIPNPAAAMPWVFVLMLVAMVEAARIVVHALWKRVPGARLVGSGILAVAFGFGVGLLANLGALPASQTTKTLIPFSSMVVLLAMMSFHISRQFAQTNQRLREKLVEVQQLSAQQLEAERRMQSERVERSLLQAEYDRKVRELEEARELQLSMLPSHVPELLGIELAAWMGTATEVGGDYYDFEVGDDGSLMIALGDATGHGMRAGTMVTATKALFGVFGQTDDLSGTMVRSAGALRRMNLRRLAMALTLARYRSGTLRISAAGMPPLFVCRAATGRVEQVEVPGMPLGAARRFPYSETSIRLESGDTVLFMTDGFPERLSREGELLGYDRALEAFRAAAPASPASIINSLRQAAETWAEGCPAEDDVTFVVLKIRRAAGQD